MLPWLPRPVQVLCYHGYPGCTGAVLPWLPQPVLALCYHGYLSLYMHRYLGYLSLYRHCYYGYLGLYMCHVAMVTSACTCAILPWLPQPVLALCYHGYLSLYMRCYYGYLGLYMCHVAMVTLACICTMLPWLPRPVLVLYLTNPVNCCNPSFSGSNTGHSYIALLLVAW